MSCKRMITVDDLISQFGVPADIMGAVDSYMSVGLIRHKASAVMSLMHEVDEDFYPSDKQMTLMDDYDTEVMKLSQKIKQYYTKAFGLRSI